MNQLHFLSSFMLKGDAYNFSENFKLEIKCVANF